MNTYNVSLIGTEGTGKSCFLAGMNHIGANPLSGSFTVSPKMNDPIGKQYLKEFTDTLSSGKFPSGTHTTTFLEFEVQLGDTVMCIKTMDYPGEDFRAGITTETPEAKIKEFAEHLLKSDIIILLADPHAIPAQETNIVQRNKIIDSINTNLQAARDVFNENKAKYKELKYADVCIAVGKFDKLPEFAAAKKAKDGGKRIAKQFFQKHWANFSKNLAATTKIKLKEINYFPISAVGNTIQTEDSTSRDEDGLAPDRDNLAPFGYDKLFRWIADRKNRLAWRKFLKKCVAALFILIVLGVGAMSIFGTKTVVEIENEKQQLEILARQDISITQKLEATEPPASDNVTQKRNDILDEELQRLNNEIETCQDSQTLDFYRKKIEEIDAVYDGDRNINIENLLKQINEKLVENEFQRVKDSFENNRKTFEEDAQTFLTNHPNEPQADDVRKMLADKETQDIKDARLRIKNIAVRDAGSLQNKGKAIVQFLETYRNKLTQADAEAMQRAAELAKKFSEPQKYTITLKQYGGFAYAEDIKGHISINNVTVGSHNSAGKCQTANASETFTMSWQCGQTIKLEIQAYAGTLWGGIETVADKSDSGPDALKMLSLRTPLSAKTRGSVSGSDWNSPRLKSASGFFMQCEIKEINATDWKAFETYILPGNGW